jgi:hypothetical protein
MTLRSEALMEIETNSVVVSGPGRDNFRGHSRLERAVLPFVREPLLWPVLATVVVHGVALAAPLLVLCVRDRHAWASAGVAALALATAAAAVSEIRDRRRPASICALLAGVWLLTGVASLVAVRLGIF